MGFDSRSLNLCRRCSGRGPRGLPGRRRGEVGLLLAGVQHHRGGRGRVLLDRMDCSGRAGVLQVVLPGVVVMVEVRRWEVRELVMVVWVMSRHRRGATVVRSHHFCGIGGRGFTQSH